MAAVDTLVDRRRGPRRAAVSFHSQGPSVLAGVIRVHVCRSDAATPDYLTRFGAAHARDYSWPCGCVQCHKALRMDGSRTYRFRLHVTCTASPTMTPSGPVETADQASEQWNALGPRQLELRLMRSRSQLTMDTRHRVKQIGSLKDRLTQQADNLRKQEGDALRCSSRGAFEEGSTSRNCG